MSWIFFFYGERLSLAVVIFFRCVLSLSYSPGCPSNFVSGDYERDNVWNFTSNSSYNNTVSVGELLLWLTTYHQMGGKKRSPRQMSWNSLIWFILYTNANAFFFCQWGSCRWYLKKMRKKKIHFCDYFVSSWATKETEQGRLLVYTDRTNNQNNKKKSRKGIKKGITEVSNKVK